MIPQLDWDSQLLGSSVSHGKTALNWASTATSAGCFGAVRREIRYVRTLLDELADGTPILFRRMAGATTRNYEIVMRKVKTAPGSSAAA